MRLFEPKKEKTKERGKVNEGLYDLTFRIMWSLPCGKRRRARMLLTFSVAQQPLKSIDRPLIRVSLSEAILVTFIFC